MLFFLAFIYICCAVVSPLRNIAKETAWQKWDIFPEATVIFSKLSKHQPTIEDDDMKIIERLWSWCMTNCALQMVWMKPGWNCLSESTDHNILWCYPSNQTNSDSYNIPARLCVGSGEEILCQPEEANPAAWGLEKIGKEWKVFWTTNSPIVYNKDLWTAH